MCLNEDYTAILHTENYWYLATFVGVSWKCNMGPVLWDTVYERYYFFGFKWFSSVSVQRNATLVRIAKFRLSTL